MKNTLYIIIISILAISCGGSPTDSLKSSDKSISTTIGTVEGLQIKDIPYGTSLDDFRNAISVSDSSQFEILKVDGITPAVELKTSTRLKVTAEDNSTETYLVEVLPDPRVVGEFNGFNSDSTDYQVVGGSFVEGFGSNTSALSFTGSTVENNYMVIPYDENDPKYNLTAKGTIEVLVKANSFKPYAGILSKGQVNNFSDESYGIQLWPKDGSNARLLFFIYGENGQWIGVNGTYNLEANKWYHIVATWDENKMYLYVNGVLDSSRDNTAGNVRSTTGGLTVGAQLTEGYNDTYGNFGWDGIIDRVSIFNEVMNADEVQSRYDEIFN